MANFYGATALTGGTSGCLDAINGALLSDGDMALVRTLTTAYEYTLDADSAAAQSSPGVISPVTNAGDKRWIRSKSYLILSEIDGLRYAADAEASDTYVITLSPVPAALYTGMTVTFKANTANTGACTLNVNSLGAKSIKKLHDQDPATGDIESGQMVTVVYDGTNFQMQSQIATSGLISSDSIWDAAGDIVYGTGADTASKLAIGAANLKLFVNAGATAPEWAAGIKIGTFTRDLAAASGDVQITGVGFKPSHVIFLLSPPSGGATHASWGFSNATLNYGVVFYNNTILPSSDYGASCIVGVPASGNYQIAIVKTMDADGFTLTWTKTVSPTGVDNIYYMAFR